jgi:phosphoribosyl 1,2-cyclic phosphodiesterase
MPAIRAICLASGSKGNSLFIEGGGVRILVDAGLSCRQVEARLTEAGIDPRSIDAILVTHEHMDHVFAVPLFSKRFGTPVYVSLPTACRPIAGGSLKNRVGCIHIIEAGQTLILGELSIDPFPISHDAIDPLAFRFETGGAAMAMAADLGVATKPVYDRLAGCQAIFCESNHDPAMLRNGPYSPPLKKRVSGDSGHLSNPDCRKLVESVHHPDLEIVVLTHLSEKNNTPQLAYDETNGFLRQISAKTELRIAFQDKIGTPVEIG